MDPWQPRQYEHFKAERSRPFFDLLALVRPRAGMRVLDLGCGTGELTREAHRQLKAATTVGVDKSPAMLAQSGAFREPGLTFVQEDIFHFCAAAQEPFDLVLSNAALHWVPDHEQLLSQMARLVAPGGQLAVQIPVNHEALPHTVAEAVAAEPPFREQLGGGLPKRPVLSPERYARLLHASGLREPRVEIKVYVHLLADRSQVIEWVKGSTLTWPEERLSPDGYREFLARYRTRLFLELPDEKPFFFTFRRLFVWGQKGEGAP
jgi:trans-aconitate 2-methyltransferase